MSYNKNFISKDHANINTENKTKATPIAMVAPEVKHEDVDMEITKTCAVLGCEDSKHFDENSFFRFPEDHQLRQIWTDLTGRNNWTPTDYSYICIQHFSVDCFKCDGSDTMKLVDDAVPSQKLPGHVLEVEYIDEETLDNEDYEDSAAQPMADEFEEEIEPIKTYNGIDYNDREKITSLKNISPEKTLKKKVDDLEALKLFTEVQKIQRQAVILKGKLNELSKVQQKQRRSLKRVEEIIQRKRKILEAKKKKKSRILLSLQDKVNEDINGLVLAMPVKQTEDMKSFALRAYNYSPQAYIFVRNTLRTLLPSTDVLESWLSAGFQPKTAAKSTNLIKIQSQLTETELTCKISFS
ncbi:hypothetical protein ACJJTC_015033 [Scirpophaga incertulas]